ncbi:uncharacterized protein CLUP02_17808 [Colletotrichum lupini]|uniref:Uncharacterized protein n=1 Tax=Colletotrichum lupini TaxID=145971 RepID=A0A9Q8WBA4_9PEZI|nr:uncharacterized protein CLUP02_17808 [Colletotrichum lupini]UQC76295.1 hypothetical protein CLUP02_17808 [Colletotrichum lupini]
MISFTGMFSSDQQQKSLESLAYCKRQSARNSHLRVRTGVALPRKLSPHATVRAAVQSARVQRASMSPSWVRIFDTVNLIFAASPQRDATRRACGQPIREFSPPASYSQEGIADGRQWPIIASQTSPANIPFHPPFRLLQAATATSARIRGTGANDYFECSHLSHHFVSAARLEATDGIVHSSPGRAWVHGKMLGMLGDVNGAGMFMYLTRSAHESNSKCILSLQLSQAANP